MKRKDVEENTGAKIRINGLGDLAFEGGLRKYIYDKEHKYDLRIEKLTRGGMVWVRDLTNNKFISVPAKNVTVLKKEETGVDVGAIMRTPEMVAALTKEIDEEIINDLRGEFLQPAKGGYVIREEKEKEMNKEKIEWYSCWDLNSQYGRWEFVFTDEEIQEVIDEYYNEHTYIGTENPVTIDERTAEIILGSRKRHQEWINSVHPSHDMTEWGTKIIAPVATPRFYAHRECKKCGYEQYHHPAGKFIDSQLKEECKYKPECDGVW